MFGDFNIGHAAFTALAGDYSHPWAVDGFATSAAVAEGPLITKRRTPFFLSGNELPDSSMKKL